MTMNSNHTPPETCPYARHETMTIEEGAAYLKTSPETVEKLIRSGDIPACRVGRLYVLMRQNLYNFLLLKTQQQSSERRNILQREDELKAAIQAAERTTDNEPPAPRRRGRPRKPRPPAAGSSFSGRWPDKEE